MEPIGDDVRLEWKKTPRGVIEYDWSFPSQEFVDSADFGKVSPESRTWDDDGVVYAAERLKIE